MSRFMRAASSLLFAVALMAGATTAASADNGRVEVYWATTNTSEPTAETVNWPQVHSPGGAVECGVWYQVDTYKKKDVAALIADGILERGEDYKVVISWRFEYGGDCEPPFVPERFVEERTNGPLEPTCETPSVSWETWTVEWFSNEDGTFTEPVEVADTRTPHEDALTEEELLACNPPTEPPTEPEEPSEPPTVPEEPTTPVEPPTTPEEPSEPPSTPPATTEPPTTPEEPPSMTQQRVDELPETGLEEHVGALSIAALLLGAGVVLVIRRRSAL